jgi:type VI secretion system protein ImpA
MAVIEFAALTSPVSGDAPCGIDLDLAGDSDFMNYIARAEGLLPATFFSGPDGKPFDRAAIDFNAEFEAAKPFLGKTRDLRLLLLLAKFCVLTRDLEGFSLLVSAVAKLLEEHWDDVHPHGEDGDFGIRIAVLETLDDAAPVLLPLQYVRLIEDKRIGVISYRNYMLAAGEVQPREGEDLRDQATLDRAMMEAELPALIERRRQIEAVQAALRTIEQICAERTGQRTNIEKLPALADKIFGLLNAIIAKRDPSAAVAEPAETAAEAGDAAAPAAIVVGRIAGKADAAAALAAIARYFNEAEPSNPALLLVRQAEQLMGKSLVEVMQVLMPSQFDRAKFWIGKDQAFDIPIERLAPFASIEPVAGNGAAPEETADASEPGSDEQPEPGAPRLVQGRGEAFALLEQVTAYFRVAEPSSPIALITERARTLGERDFLTLLKELLPGS